MKRFAFALALLSTLACASHVGVAQTTAAQTTAAQTTAAQTTGEHHIQLEPAQVQKWEIGVVVEATGTITGIEASLPVPMDWPEQKVKIVSRDLSGGAKSVRFRTLSGGVRQMIVIIPRLSAGQTARAVVQFEVQKHNITEPRSTDGLRIPKRVDRQLRQFLLPSPKIESSNPKIQAIAKQIVDTSQPAWNQVETIFDWVRENIEYKFDPTLRGALVALDRRVGDCEEMTSLFVALCRVHKIPARSVWIPGHCYPEFYLEGANGKGYWYPCQAAGTRAFGAMPEKRPVLQKGDSFRLPRQRKPVRYVSETLAARNAKGAPKVQWIKRELK